MNNKQTFHGIMGIFLMAALAAGCSQGPGKENQKDDSPASAPSDPMANKGIGPVINVALGDLNAEMAEEGKKIYEQKCVSCHNIDKKLIGPPQAGVLKRRTPEWVMNMMLNPDEMLKKDPTARQLLKEFNNVPMTNQNLTEEEARKILEYFRTM